MPTLSARSFAGVLLPLVLAGCATEFPRPAPEIAGPAPTREYRLADDLCDQLDPAPLITLTGISTAQTTFLGANPDGRRLRCSLSTFDREKAWGYGLPLSISLDDTADGADRASTPGPQDRHRAVPGLGDSAVIQLTDSLALPNPYHEGQEIQRQSGWLTVTQGPVTFVLGWEAAGGTAFPDAEVEALLVGYARQVLDMVDG